MLDALGNSLDFVGLVVVIIAAAAASVFALLSDTWHSSLQASEKCSSYVRIVCLR